jgi:hypothetical protein
VAAVTSDEAPLVVAIVLLAFFLWLGWKHRHVTRDRTGEEE